MQTAHTHTQQQKNTSSEDTQKTDREKNSGNETKEEWKRQSVPKQYLKYCTPLNLLGTELGPLLSCCRVEQSAKRRAAGVLKCTVDKQIKRTDRQNFSHCTLRASNKHKGICDKCDVHYRSVRSNTILPTRQLVAATCTMPANISN